MSAENRKHLLTNAPSFHSRVGKEPSLPNQGNGFPVPGEQNPTARMVMDNDYFVSAQKWANIVRDDTYDYIVIGSGCTGLAFISQMLETDPTKKILCLERGDFLLPSHFQNLPLPFKMVLGGPSETFPWTLSEKTFKEPLLKYCHGSCPFFGGRSTFWSAWSPQPTIQEMRDFPPDLIAQTEEPGFWKAGENLLNVTLATDIDDTIFAGLQDEVDKRLESPLPHIPSATRSFSAPLAVGRASPTSTIRFNKFSTPGPLLGIFDRQRKLNLEDPQRYPRLDIMLNCAVQKFGQPDEDGLVRSIKTSQGQITWQGDNTKVIICAGVFPAAAMLVNSFESCKMTVGKRISGHFLTHIVARVPKSSFGPWKPPVSTKSQRSHLEIAAHYLAGEHSQSKQQFHVQITAIHSPDPKQDAVDAARECPDYAAAATEAQLKDSTEHVVFVCATLGEFTEKNPNNWFKQNNGDQDPTTNMKLQYTLVQDDRDLWNLMDEATYQTIEQMSVPKGQSTENADLEYWHMTGASTGEWTKARPPTKEIRIPGIVHETSTAFVGAEKDGGSCDADGVPHGLKNIHVTGGALFPTSGSWNPTLTMCCFTQRLARKLAQESKSIT